MPQSKTYRIRASNDREPRNITVEHRVSTEEPWHGRAYYKSASRAMCVLDSLKSPDDTFIIKINDFKKGEATRAYLQKFLSHLEDRQWPAHLCQRPTDGSEELDDVDPEHEDAV